MVPQTILSIREMSKGLGALCEDGTLGMSSSLTATRFPALRIHGDRPLTDPVQKDTAATAVEPSDETLIARLCSDDKEALGLLFRRYARLVHSIGKKILRDSAEAEDFVQELFLHLFRKARLYDASKGPARGWIVQTTYFQVLHRRAQLRARAHYVSAELDETEAVAIVAPAIAEYDRSGEGLFGRVRWRELIKCLTEDQWETFRLHFVEGYTFSEISELRKQSIANVRHHFYRGLERLRKHIFASELRDR